MHISVSSPSRAYISGHTMEDLHYLAKALSYVNTAAKHLLKRHYANHWFKAKDPQGWEFRAEELKKEVNKTLVFKEDGKYFIRPGSLSYLNLPNTTVENTIKYPKPKKIAWANPLPFDLHYYQEASAEELIKIIHGNVELCTGAGKSAIILKVCRETGFNTAIIAPSQSIFNELVEKFEFHFGKGNVGKFGDGKKKLGKRFTICIGDSLSNVKPGTPEWEFFSKMDMFCVDESHTWGADTLESVCHGVLSEVPYRMFFSGTQTRGDGGEKLLQSIIGPTVHTLTTKAAVEGGFICKHEYAIVNVESSNPNIQSNDPLEMKRIHFLRNRNIARTIANLCNATGERGQQSLVLVEELSQIAMLIPLLRVPYAYAHSEKNAGKLETGGLEKVDRANSVELFNKNEVKVLIGTSCISTGTNIYPTHYTFNWVGGASEIKTKQGAVGRSVRLGNQNKYQHLCLPKEKAVIFDFNVHDVYIMVKHLEERIGFYNESGSTIRYITPKR